jgi:hypothetical protein
MQDQSRCPACGQLNRESAGFCRDCVLSLEWLTGRRPRRLARFRHRAKTPEESARRGASETGFQPRAAGGNPRSRCGERLPLRWRDVAAMLAGVIALGGLALAGLGHGQRRRPSRVREPRAPVLAVLASA